MPDVHVLEPGEDPTKVPLSERRLRRRRRPGLLLVVMIAAMVALFAFGAWGIFGRKKSAQAETPPAAEPTSTPTPTPSPTFQPEAVSVLELTATPMPENSPTNPYALTVTALWFGPGEASPTLTTTPTLVGPLTGGYPVATATSAPPPATAAPVVIRVEVTRIVPVPVTQIVYATPGITIVYVVVTATPGAPVATATPTQTQTATPTVTASPMPCAGNCLYLPLVVR